MHTHCLSSSADSLIAKSHHNYMIPCILLVQCACGIQTRPGECAATGYIVSAVYTDTLYQGGQWVLSYSLGLYIWRHKASTVNNLHTFTLIKSKKVLNINTSLWLVVIHCNSMFDIKPVDIKPNIFNNNNKIKIEKKQYLICFMLYQ